MIHNVTLTGSTPATAGWRAARGGVPLALRVGVVARVRASLRVPESSEAAASSQWAARAQAAASAARAAAVPPGGTELGFLDKTGLLAESVLLCKFRAPPAGCQSRECASLAGGRWGSMGQLSLPPRHCDEAF